MTNIFDFYVFPETRFLEELAEELESTFHVIAYAGHETNLRYIRERQSYFSRKYGRFIARVISDTGEFHIVPAYDTLQDLLNDNPSSDEIRQAAEECLAEHLNIVGYSEQQLEAFDEFMRMINE
jgi:hypothetical protein